MAEPLRVRLAGYAPAASTHGRALDRIAAGLRAELGDGVTVEIDDNILDSGRPAQALLDDVEAGRTTLCYFSSSYLAQRVPGLGIIDLPPVFDSLDHAHAALDGQLGATLSERTRHATALVPLGYWDNGFRYISNRSRVIRSPPTAAACASGCSRTGPTSASSARWAASRSATTCVRASRC